MSASQGSGNVSECQNNDFKVLLSMNVKGVELHSNWMCEATKHQDDFKEVWATDKTVK